MDTATLILATALVLAEAYIMYLHNELARARPSKRLAIRALNALATGDEAELAVLRKIGLEWVEFRKEQEEARK